MRCPHCQQELPEDASFCSFCGNVITKKICPQCHHEINDSELFCQNCGYQLFREDDHTQMTRINNIIENNKKEKKKKKNMIIIACVAVALVIAGVGSYFLFFRSSDEPKQEIVEKTEENEETETLEVENDEFELEVGDEDHIIIETKTNCKYKVKDESIVEVDSFGTIKALKEGETEIVVKAENGDTVTCKVTVIESEQNIEILNYQASSTFSQTGYSYVVSQLYDGSLTTCWAEGVDGYGIGETVTVNYKNEVKLNQMKIYNGYNKTYDLYYKNGRVKQVTLTFDDGSTEIINVADSYNQQLIYTFPEHKTKSVVLKIDSVYEGSRYEDTSITLLSFDYKK